MASMEQTMIQLNDNKNGTTCHRCSRTNQDSDANTEKNNCNNDDNSEDTSTQGLMKKLAVLRDNTKTMGVDHPGKRTQKLTISFAGLRDTNKAAAESHPSRYIPVASNRAPTPPGVGRGKEKMEPQILLAQDWNQDSLPCREVPNASNTGRKGEKEKNKTTNNL